MNGITAPVVVGVDGTTPNRGALRFAVEEVRRTGGSLKLVHVVPDYVPISPFMPVTPGDLTDTGTQVLTGVEDTVRELAPDLDVQGWLHHGSRATELIKAAEGASMLVVGRDDRPVLYRLVDGDTATRTASRAAVPVVEVPAGWHEDDATERGVVVVGVKTGAHADDLLGHAFAVADARGAKVVVVHAWKLPSAYDDIIESRIALEQCEKEGVVEMEALLHDWREAFPHVAVEIRVVHDHAAHALVETSRQADLVVVVRRAHGVPAAAHLGGTARAVLRGAECPVMVVPPSAVPEMPDLVLETGGQIRK
ncbi:MAG TPA: universal stress protein [Nocardioides sp.]|nr:universal stress protein [Nocardioides sp.]